jgi:hypothetical protein
VEDRLTPGLFLELLDADPDEYARTRVPELLATPGVERVTWWHNLRPGRDELPMRITDGTLLGVAEVSEAFTGAPPSAGTAAHFRRYPRPNQGCLTGRPTTGLLVVWITPKRPELAQQVRDWADFVHLRHIAAVAVPGYTVITPYENVTGADPRFMHFYEMDTDDPEGAYQLMPKLVAERLGGADSPEFFHWADWKGPGFLIVYVNTFRRLGASDA